MPRATEDGGFSTHWLITLLPGLSLRSLSLSLSAAGSAHGLNLERKREGESEWLKYVWACKIPKWSLPQNLRQANFLQVYLGQDIARKTRHRPGLSWAEPASLAFLPGLPASWPGCLGGRLCEKLAHCRFDWKGSSRRVRTISVWFNFCTLCPSSERELIFVFRLFPSLTHSLNLCVHRGCPTTASRSSTRCSTSTLLLASLSSFYKPTFILLLGGLFSCQ